MLQQFDLAQGSLGQDLLAEDIGDLLDCHTISTCCILRGTASSDQYPSERLIVRVILPDNAVCALSQLFRHNIPLVHDEVLVEDLEGLSACQVRHCEGRSSFRFRGCSSASLQCNVVLSNQGDRVKREKRRSGCNRRFQVVVVPNKASWTPKERR